MQVCGHSQCTPTMAFDKGITLYTAGTPNGWKANMVVEELKVPYKLHAISLSDNEQKQEWFEKINPNGRIPAIGEIGMLSGFAMSAVPVLTDSSLLKLCWPL